MAKVYVQGVTNGFIEVSDNEARRVEKQKIELVSIGKFNPKSQIRIGNYSGDFGKITGFQYLDESLGKNQSDRDRAKYFNETNLLRNSLPEEKSKNCWGHFNFYHFGVFGIDADREKFARLVEEKALDFFKKEENKNRLLVGIENWSEILGLEDSKKVSKGVFKILNMCQSSDIADSKYLVNVKARESNLERDEEEVLEIINGQDLKVDEIKDEDLPF